MGQLRKQARAGELSPTTTIYAALGPASQVRGLFPRPWYKLKRTWLIIGALFWFGCWAGKDSTNYSDPPHKYSTITLSPPKRAGTFTSLTVNSTEEEYTPVHDCPLRGRLPCTATERWIHELHDYIIYDAQCEILAINLDAQDAKQSTPAPGATPCPPPSTPPAR